jgi:hypothetical protein
MSVVTRQALNRDFTRSAEQTTWYDVAVFAVSFILVLALPKVDSTRLDAHPPAGP